MRFLRRLQLDLDATAADVRRAYARELKRIDVDADPAGFQELRAAYEAALGWVESGRGEPVLEQVAEGGAFYRPAPLPPGGPLAASDLPSSPLPAPPPPVGPVALSGAVAAADRFHAALPTGDLARVEIALRQALEDPALVPIGAREAFESRLVEHLLQGWRAGHELLFEAAVVVFDWERDHRRLSALDAPVRVIHQALRERVPLAGDASLLVAERRRVLELLRDEQLPGERDLIRLFPALQELVSRQPNHLRIVAPSEAVARWEAAFHAAPKWKRAAFFERPPMAPAAPAPDVEAGTGWKLFGGVLLFLFLQVVGAASRC